MEKPAQSRLYNATFVLAGLLALVILYYGARNLRPRAPRFPLLKPGPARLPGYDKALAPALPPPVPIGADRPNARAQAKPAPAPPAAIPLPDIVHGPQFKRGERRRPAPN